jgi:hypothetical protein
MVVLPAAGAEEAAGAAEDAGAEEAAGALLDAPPQAVAMRTMVNAIAITENFFIILVTPIQFFLTNQKAIILFEKLNMYNECKQYDNHCSARIHTYGKSL